MFGLTVCLHSNIQMRHSGMSVASGVAGQITDSLNSFSNYKM